MEFDVRRPLTLDEISDLAELVQAIRSGTDDIGIAAVIHRAIEKNKLLFGLLLQLVGLTRNKILQDLKAAHSVIRHTLRLTNYESLGAHPPTWAVAGPYLASRLRRVMEPLAIFDQRDAFAASFEALNQATWPGYIRQERAKRSGHEAEYRMAVLLRACGIPFEPEEKADNPLCRDAQVHGVSFDIVVPHTKQPRVCIKATVHTANIGQYGESKDHLEMGEARRMIDERFGEDKPILLGFIDGVGFESNRAGLRGVLEKSDEFCQFKTIWKLLVVAARQLKCEYRLYLPIQAIEAHAEFLNRQDARAKTFAIEEESPPVAAVIAGEGQMFLKNVPIKGVPAVPTFRRHPL